MNLYRATLADQTRTAHEALHDHFWISQLSQPTLTVDVYARLLTAYHRFYTTVELQREHRRQFGDLSLSGVIASLRADLDVLVPARSGPSDALALPYRTDAALLGALYVLHGARFGARILSRNVAQALPDAPQNYLLFAGPRTLWPSLLDALETTGQTPGQLRAMILGANRTFEAFGQHVTQQCEDQLHSV